MKNRFVKICIAAFFFVFPLLIFSGPASGPTVSLSIENQPLRTALEEISEQTALRFVYHDDLIADRTVMCRCRDAGLEDALALVLKETDLGYRVVSPGTVVLYRKAPEPAMASSIIDIQPEVPPRLLYEIEPYYPRLARISGIEGDVVINCLISTDGRVGDTEVIQSSGHPSLDAAARTFARRLEFAPARQGEDSVDVWLSLEVNFELDARRISPDAYLVRIQDLRQHLASAEASERDSILHVLLDVHTDFVATTHRSKQNRNAVLGELLLPEIQESWETVWESHPLHFLVFHDFIIRYPDSQETSDAELSLLYYIQRIIHPYLDMTDGTPHEGDPEGSFLRYVHRFLKEYYPQALSRELDEAVQALSM